METIKRQLYWIMLNEEETKFKYSKNVYNHNRSQCEYSKGEFQMPLEIHIKCYKETCIICL